MTGKQRCEFLKRIRIETAAINGIDLPAVPECTYQGPCPGYCEVCDNEARLLGKKISELEAKGTKIALLDDYKKIINELPEDKIHQLDNQSINQMHKTLHFIKMSLNNVIIRLDNQSISSNERRHLNLLKDSLLDYVHIIQDAIQKDPEDHKTMGVIAAHPVKKSKEHEEFERFLKEIRLAKLKAEEDEK